VREEDQVTPLSAAHYPTERAAHVEELRRQIEALQAQLVELARERKVKAGETLPPAHKRVEKKATDVPKSPKRR
jgi:hypothetical protein